MSETKWKLTYKAGDKLPKLYDSSGKEVNIDGLNRIDMEINPSGPPKIRITAVGGFHIEGQTAPEVTHKVTI